MLGPCCEILHLSTSQEIMVVLFRKRMIIPFTSNWYHLPIISTIYIHSYCLWYIKQRRIATTKKTRTFSYIFLFLNWNGIIYNKQINSCWNGASIIVPEPLFWVVASTQQIWKLPSQRYTYRTGTYYIRQFSWKGITHQRWSE